MCPSDGLSPKLHTFWGGLGTDTQGFSGNFVANAGNDYFNPATTPDGRPQNSLDSSARLNGVFFAQSKVRIAQIEDGTTHTALISELILSPDTTSHDIRGRYYNPGHGGVLFSTRIPPNTLVPDRFNWCSDNPVPRAPCIWSASNMFVSARSYHPGGVNMAMADGAVRFVDQSVDAAAYAAAGSRNGQEAKNL
jgi:prepilin-type processing-associated H-X9-DG protein